MSIKNSNLDIFFSYCHRPKKIVANELFFCSKDLILNFVNFSLNFDFIILNAKELFLFGTVALHNLQYF